MMRTNTYSVVAATMALASAPLVAQVARPMPVPALPQRPTIERPTVPVVPPIAKPAPMPMPTPIPQPMPMPQPPANQSGYFAGTIKCESQNYRTRTCRARTQGRVEIVQVHGGSCTRNRSFRYDNDSITVSDGCRATFAYGYGNVRPKADSGSSALPWMLAGAGATAGIVALANSGNDTPAEQPRPAPAPAPPPPAEAAPPPPPAPPAPEAALPQPPFPSLPPAQIDANIQMLTADQQRVMQICLLEGARQVGIAGGSKVRLVGFDSIDPGNGGWRFRFRGEATFPNGTRPFSVLCRATSTQIVEFTAAPIGPTTSPAN